MAKFYMTAFLAAALAEEDSTTTINGGFLAPIEEHRHVLSLKERSANGGGEIGASLKEGGNFFYKSCRTRKTILGVARDLATRQLRCSKKKGCEWQSTNPGVFESWDEDCVETKCATYSGEGVEACQSKSQRTHGNKILARAASWIGRSQPKKCTYYDGKKICAVDEKDKRKQIVEANEPAVVEETEEVGEEPISDEEKKVSDKKDDEVVEEDSDNEDNEAEEVGEEPNLAEDDGKPKPAVVEEKPAVVEENNGVQHAPTIGNSFQSTVQRVSENEDSNVSNDEKKVSDEEKKAEEVGEDPPRYLLVSSKGKAAELYAESMGEYKLEDGPELVWKKTVPQNKEYFIRRTNGIAGGNKWGIFSKPPGESQKKALFLQTYPTAFASPKDVDVWSYYNNGGLRAFHTDDDTINVLDAGKTAGTKRPGRYGDKKKSN